MPRVLELFSKRGLVPTAWTSRVAGEELAIDVQMRGMDDDLAEYVAACLAGVFSVEDGLRMVLKRGQLFEQVEKGAMLSVPLPADDLRALIGDKLDIFWFHDDGRSRMDDKKPIEGPFTVFEFAPTDAGLYHVEVDANGRPIALVEFEVK